MNNEVISTYVHIPFCKKICTYCDFCHLLYNEEFVFNYLLALEKEIIEKYNKEKIRTLYIGGGTPSCLSVPALKKFFNIMNLFDLSLVEEYTFECNLDDIRVELLEILKENRVNRLSIGIESFNENKLKILGREAEFKDAKDKISLCRKYGFDNINVDLMYAVDGETMGNLTSDLRKIVKLKTEHISTYSLIIEDNTILKQKGINYISEKLDNKMYNKIKSFLKRKGYNHYEVSNFAKSGFESKHNLVYWNNEEYYGFGLSAAGYYEGVRYENNNSLKLYINNDYTKEQNMISKKERMDYELMLGLRKLSGINIDKFEEKFEENLFEIYNIDEQINQKNIINNNGFIYINPKKIYLMNEILIKLI